MAILVSGGAGYIGSHCIYSLIDKGEEIIVVDNLKRGHEAALHDDAGFYHGDIRDRDFLNRIFEDNEIEGVIHFAAHSIVGESVTNPLEYYNNNLYGSMVLLEKMIKFNVRKIVFSSTAAVYGEPSKIPIVESDATIPTNPYGETKLAVEKMLKWAHEAHNIKYVSLRYFNVAGAHSSGRIGEDHERETHLIPLILQVALEKRDSITIFGDDYDTYDGTCIRDYIHVMDLVDAHILALDKLRRQAGSFIYNLGNGQGFSVKEIIDAARRVTGHPIPAMIGQRRKGDPSKLIASSRKAQDELGWKTRYRKIDDIIASAWKWHSSHPQGYNE